MIKLLPYILFETQIYILALEMASPGNQHCANCIGTLSFPMQLDKRLSNGTLRDLRRKVKEKKEELEGRAHTGLGPSANLMACIVESD